MSENEVLKVVEDIKSELRTDFDYVGCTVTDESLDFAVKDTFDYDAICDYANKVHQEYLLLLKLDVINKVMKNV